MITDTELELERLERLEKHAREMSDALIRVRPLGGSELFVRIGDEFYADPKYCGEAITQTKAELHEARKTTAIAERRAEAAEAENERLRKALGEIVEFCDDPDGSEKPESLALGLARLLPAARLALEACTLTGDRHREAALHNNLADLYHALGQAEQAMDHLRRAVVIFTEIGEEGGTANPEIWKLMEW